MLEKQNELNNSKLVLLFFFLFKEKGSLALKTINLNQITVFHWKGTFGVYFKLDLGQGAHNRLKHLLQKNVGKIAIKKRLLWQKILVYSTSTSRKYPLLRSSSQFFIKSSLNWDRSSTHSKSFTGNFWDIAHPYK